MEFFDGLFTNPGGWYSAHELLVGQMGINALLAISIWVTLYAGQLTMANVGFMAIGGYASVILAIELGWPLLVGAIAGGLLAMVVALVIGLPVLRFKGLFVAIATIGFGEAVRFGPILNLNITGKGQGLNNPDADPAFIWPIWLSVAIVAFLGWRMTRTRLGLAWAAIREDEMAARSSGVDTTRYKLAAFVLGALLAAWAGALESHLNFFIDPTEYTVNRAVFVLVLAVVGGMATVFGPVVGAVALTALPEIVRSFATYRDVIYGALLIVIVIFRPTGIVGRGRAWQWLRERVGPRCRAADPRCPSRPMPEAAMSEALLVATDVVRHFGGVKAVDGVSLEVVPGQVTGLIGRNGAGKTTLVNVFTGLVPPQSGSVRLDGAEIGGLPAHKVARLGVARTFQNIRLYKSLTALENVVAGQHLHRRNDLLASLVPGRLSRLGSALTERKDRARELLDTVGLPPGVASREAGTLAYGDQRRLEIARALATQPRALVLDEPAAGMNPSEKGRLSELLASLAAGGLAVLLIEHDIKLVMRLCAEIVVLDFGKRIAAGPPATVAEDPAVIAAYLGTKAAEQASSVAVVEVAVDEVAVGDSTAATPSAASAAEPILSVDNLEVAYGAIEALQGVSLHVAPGEVVALIGANGAGKSTLLRTLSGLLRPKAGTATFAGLDLTRASSSAIVRAGLVQVPEGREILAAQTVRENLAARRLRPPRQGGGGGGDRGHAGALPALGQPGRQPRRPALGGRAATVGHRPGAAGQAPPPGPRRAVTGPGSPDGRADLRPHRRHRRRRHDRAPGRAERPGRPGAGLPGLCGRDRTGRAGGRGFCAAGRSRRPGRLSRELTGSDCLVVVRNSGNNEHIRHKRHLMPICYQRLTD